MENIIWAYIAEVILLLITLINIYEAKKHTNTKGFIGNIIIITSILAYILLTPLIIILLGFFAIYRQTISLILKITHGSKYGGLIKGSDAFHTIGEPANSIINCMMIVQCTKKLSSEEIFNNIKEVIWNLYRDSKFKSFFLKSFGYSYMVLGEFTPEDCFKKLKHVNTKNSKINKNELLEILQEHCNLPLGANETISWQVLIGLQPVNWKDDDNEYYPLLFRINHAVADGVTLLKLMVGSLADKQDIKIVSTHPEQQPQQQKVPEKVDNKTFYNRTRNFFTSFITCIYVFILIPASVCVSLFLKAKDSNILHGPTLTGKKILAMSVEENQEYFHKTKRIKNRIPGTSFPDVLLAAFSGSLSDYFKKNSNSPPGYITATIPMRSGSSDLHRLIPGECDIDTLNVRNKYSFLLMDLPIIVSEESTSNRLELIKKETNKLRNSVDYQVNYLVMSLICAFFPQSFVKFILNGTHCSTVLSILAGPPKVTYCGGTMIVSSLVPWVPHLHNIGTTFSIITYDGRLHIGLSADEALIPDQESAQSVVDGIYRHLDLLDKETKCSV